MVDNMGLFDDSPVDEQTGRPRIPGPDPLAYLTDPFGTNQPVSPNVPTPVVPGPSMTPGQAIPTGGQPTNPLDRLLGNYTGAVKGVQDIENTGPEQFHPSIWRRIAGAGLGTLAGMGGGRQGYGRYSFYQGNPAEAYNIANKFTFGPQTKMNADYERRLAAAKTGAEGARQDYEMTRQANADDLAERRLNYQENQPKLTQLKGPDGNMYPAFVGPDGTVTPFFFPESTGKGVLPDQLQNQIAQGKADPAVAARQKLDQQYNEFQNTDQFRRWKEQLDNDTKLRIAQMHEQATKDKSPAAIMQSAIFARGGLDQLRDAQQAMTQLEQSGVMGQSWAQNKLEDALFGKGVVDPSLDPQTRELIGRLRKALGFTSSATMRAHTGRTSQEIYQDFKNSLGAGQDWNALRGAMEQTQKLLTEYALAASDSSIANIRAGNLNSTPQNSQQAPPPRPKPVPSNYIWNPDVQRWQPPKTNNPR